MGLFKKTKRNAVCPICSTSLEKSDQFAHWESHVVKIGEEGGSAQGDYTWRCVCGPSNMAWPSDGGATAGLALHMEERHAIPIS
jgi:hypothetical protein